jgi:hypothetical protein
MLPLTFLDFCKLPYSQRAVLNMLCTEAMRSPTGFITYETTPDSIQVCDPKLDYTEILALLKTTFPEIQTKHYSPINDKRTVEFGFMHQPGKVATETLDLRYAHRADLCVLNGLIWWSNDYRGKIKNEISFDLELEYCPTNKDLVSLISRWKTWFPALVITPATMNIEKLIKENESNVNVCVTPNTACT